MLIRELRDQIANEYTKDDLQKTLGDVLKFTPFVLSELETDPLLKSIRSELKSNHQIDLSQAGACSSKIKCAF